MSRDGLGYVGGEAPHHRRVLQGTRDEDAGQVVRLVELVDKGRLAEAAEELQEMIQSIFRYRPANAEEDYDPYSAYEQIMRSLAKELGARRWHVSGDCTDYAELVLFGDGAFFVQVDFKATVIVGVIYKDGFDALTAEWFPHYVIEHLDQWGPIDDE